MKTANSRANTVKGKGTTPLTVMFNKIASADKKPLEGARLLEKFSVKIAAGTVVEIETVCAISSRDVKEGDQIEFRLVNPVVVNEVVVIAAGALATAIVSEAEKNNLFGRSARIAWNMKEVAAVDGTPIPLQTSVRVVGDIENGEADRQTIATGMLFFPFSPLILLYGFNRKETAFIPAGKRYNALTHRDVTVFVSSPS